MTDDNLIMDESELVEALDDDAFEEAESDHAGLEATKDPVTLREFIGLCGREYLTQHVDRDGKPAKPSHYNSTAPRIQQVLQGAIDKRFKAEIDAASRSVIAEMRDAAKAQFDALLVAEKARIRKAFDRHTEA